LSSYICPRDFCDYFLIAHSILFRTDVNPSGRPGGSTPAKRSLWLAELNAKIALNPSIFWKSQDVSSGGIIVRDDLRRDKDGMPVKSLIHSPRWLDENGIIVITFGGILSKNRRTDGRELMQEEEL